MKKPKELKEEHIQYLQEGFYNVNISLIIPHFLDKFPDLNTKESNAIIQYWINIYVKNIKELKFKDLEDNYYSKNLNNEMQLKIYAISFSNKTFRVVTEINKIYSHDINSFFPSIRYVALCDFIYDLYDKKILKSRYGNDISYETINSLFGYLPLITINGLVKEINDHFKINLKNK